MKTKEFARILIAEGFVLSRANKHEIWIKGSLRVAVPRHKTINRMVARRVLKEIGYSQRVEELNFG